MKLVWLASISKKDHHLLTLLKICDAMDKAYQQLVQEKEEARFSRLKAHKKLLILNASATPPLTLWPLKLQNFTPYSSQRKANSRLRNCYLTNSQKIETPSPRMP
jgi:hypothetical protein